MGGDKQSGRGSWLGKSREESESWNQRGEMSHLVPEAVLWDHVHQHNVLGAGNQAGEVDLTVREHPAARFGDDHLCSELMEGLPELRVLQSHPDAALHVGVRGGHHGGRRRAVEGGLQF